MPTLRVPLKNCLSSPGLAESQRLGRITASELPSLRDVGGSAVLEFASCTGPDGVERIESFCDMFSALVPTARAMMCPDVVDPHADAYLVAAPPYKYLRSDPRKCAAHGSYLQIAEVNIGSGRVIVRVPQPKHESERRDFKNAIVAALYEVWGEERADPPPNWAPAARSAHFLNFPGVWSVTMGMLLKAVEAAFESRIWASQPFDVSHVEFFTCNMKVMKMNQLEPWWILTRDLCFDARHVGKCFLLPPSDSEGDGDGEHCSNGIPAAVAVRGRAMPDLNSEFFDDATAYEFNPHTDGCAASYKVTQYIHTWASCIDLAAGGCTWSVRDEFRLDPSNYTPQLSCVKIYNPSRSDVQALLYPWCQQGHPTSRNGWQALSEKMQRAVDLFDNAANAEADADARCEAVLGRVTSIAFEYTYVHVEPARAFAQASHLTRCVVFLVQQHFPLKVAAVLFTGMLICLLPAASTRKSGVTTW